ncbi:MAG: response regulator [Gammaproteobacteria bacterium]|nr:response regulator [Gammaproteobacteria bacterium]
MRDLKALVQSGMFRNNGIGRRLIVALILFSSFMTAIITTFELYLDYDQDINGIEKRIEFIGDSYLPTLAESVWVADSQQIQTQLTGLSRLQDIESLVISIDGSDRWQVGDVHSQRTIERSLPIFRNYRGDDIKIGTLHIVASVDNVLDRLWDKLITILISNGIKTMLVSLFMLLIFQFMIGRHLEHISHYLRNLGRMPSANEKLKLVRKEDGLWRPDALDYVTRSINNMHNDIAVFQNEILQLNESLEQRVKERTQQLDDANRRLAEALKDIEEASQAKTVFLSRMSHELRTPLNAICGFSELLLNEDLNDDQRESLDWIVKAGRHLLYLINDLLDLSRIEVGKLSINMQPCDFDKLVREALKMHQSQIDYREITVQNLCTSSVTVRTDATRMTQIIVNLLSNAIKYNRTGGNIQLNCEELGQDRLRLSVTDTGYGIPKDKQALVFEPFERLGAEQSGVEGTGTGLALSKHLAELMSSAIGFHSEIGKGSTFWVDIPIAKQSVPDRLPSHTASDTHVEVITVLYVEDNTANLKLVENILKHQTGFHILTAINGMEGLDLARQEKPDVILLDIHLPMMDGYEVLEKLKSDASTRDIPVIALTADAMPGDISKGIEAGFYQYLTKPFEQIKLVNTLKSAVADTPRA